MQNKYIFSTLEGASDGKEMVRCLYLTTVICCFFESLILAGSFGGWAFITPVLKNEGIFSHLCANSSQSQENRNTSLAAYPTCIPQTEMLNLVFTLTTSMSTASTLPSGIFFQKCGLWVTRTIMILLYVLGFVLMANASAANPHLVFPGMIILGFSGSLYYITTMQAANLFEKARSTIISILSGGFLSSSVVFLLLSYVYNAGLHYSSIFYLLASLGLFSVFITFFLMPKTFIPYPLPSHFSYGITTWMKKHEDKPLSAEERSLTEENKNLTASQQETEQSYCSVFATAIFWTCIIQTVILHLCNEFFQSTFDSWIRSFTEDKGQIELFTTVFGMFILIGGLLASPLFGLLVDLAKRHFFRKYNNQELANLKALFLCSLLLGIFGVLFTTLAAIKVLYLQIFTYLVYIIFRLGIYSTSSICIVTFFPSKMFGALIGILLVFGSFVSFLRYPLLSIVLRAFGGNFTYGYILFFVLCLISFIHPVYIYWLTHNKLKQRKQLTEECV